MKRNQKRGCRRWLLVGVSVLALAGLTGCGVQKVDVMGMADLTFSGLDGEGTAQVSIPQDLEEFAIQVLGEIPSGSSQKLDYISQAVNLFDTIREISVAPSEDLSNGDQVTVTIRYNEITKIEAEPQSANVTGTVDRIIQEKGGSTLEMTLSDGDEVSYTVSSSISVTQNGKSLSLSSIQPGYRLGLVVEDDGQVVAIEVQQAVNSSNRVSGTVIYVNTSDKYIYLQVVDEGGSEDVLTVNVPSSATILDVNTGSELYLRELDPGDVIEANGAYEDGAFTATVVLKQ